MQIEATVLSEVPYRLKIVISGKLPKSANVKLRTHHFVYHKEQKGWKRAIRTELLGKLPPKPLTNAHLTIHRYNYRMLDYDGLVLSMKDVVDALVSDKEGNKQKGTFRYTSPQVLQDDAWSILGKWDVDQFFASKGKERLEITVTEVV